MVKRLRLQLTQTEKGELETIRDHHAKPYMRERAAALLRIAAGQSPHAVALEGLLKRRDPDTIYRWLERYREAGMAGLEIRPGRGRKPAFFPSV